MSESRKILLVAAELAKLAGAGGIAEYVYGLSGALVERGHEVRVVLPAWGFLLDRPEVAPTGRRLVVRLGHGRSVAARLFECKLSLPGGGDLRVSLVDCHEHFKSATDASDIYRWPDVDPWVVFSRAVVDQLIATESEWRPDVLQCNDSQTAIIPVFVQQLRESDRRAFADVRTILTVHNLLDKGIGPLEVIENAGLPTGYYEQFFEFFGNASNLKAGLLTADIVTTVSPTYRHEICRSSDFGFGLEGVLAELEQDGRLAGILNGIDERRWQLEGLNYDGTDSVDDLISRKHSARSELFDAWGWDVLDDSPVIAFRSRWDAQKGVALLVDELSAISEMARVLFVTWPTPNDRDDLWEKLQAIAADRPCRVLVNPPDLCTVHDTAVHYLVSDHLIMPSRYEPCGLCRVEGLRCGTLPIVHRTGGLADTVSESTGASYPAPNGYSFREMTATSMMGAIRRAVADLKSGGRRERVECALLQRNGWRHRVSEYEHLYTPGVEWRKPPIATQ